MNRALLTILSFLVAGSAWAVKVNPMSNILCDTAATASTCVLRNGSGTFSAASLTDATVVTAKLGIASVTTVKMYLDLESLQIACVTSAKHLGYCSGAIDSGGGCTCVEP